MPKVIISERGCRGCTLCVDICPAEVFNFDTAKTMALVTAEEDCIGCYSCFYLCPSQCIEIKETHIQRPFYRIEENVALVERFLQEKTATTTLTEKDWQEALFDVTSTMSALSKASKEMLGRGVKALGRKSGQVAAGHMPEMYEETDLEGVLQAMQRRFHHAFDFNFAKATDGTLTLSFPHCGIKGAVEVVGEKMGEANLCDLFHNYIAGLLGSYTGVQYTAQVQGINSGCTIKLTPQ